MIPFGSNHKPQLYTIFFEENRSSSQNQIKEVETAGAGARQDNDERF
jgi:hypothetical protein